VDPVKFAQWKEMRAKGEKIMLFLIVGISAVLLLIRARGFPDRILIVRTPLLARSISLVSANRFAVAIGLKEDDICSALKLQKSN